MKEQEEDLVTEKNIKEKEEELNKYREKKDRTFKTNVDICDFEKQTVGDIVGKNYHPDAIFTKSKTIIILESSSTGDRKVHIGELIQFIEFVEHDKNYEDYYFVLFLCGRSKTSPDVKNEVKRLEACLPCIKCCIKSKIKGIYIANQDKVELGSLNMEKIKSFKKVKFNS